MTTRRDFLKTSAAAGTLAAVPYFTSTRKAFANDSANDRPVIGCIGLGGMGRGDMGAHRRFGDVVALCDVDTRQIAAAKQRNDGKGDEYTDYRKVLERDDIDVISCVTTDHWHTKICIEALEAGKHVFCQKPLTLTLEENQLIRRACDKHKDKVFFVGTQQRSDRDKFLRAVNMVQKGLLGDIKKITVGINGGSVGGPFPKTTRRPNSTGISGSARHRRSTTSSNAATVRSAGGTNTRAASSPTGAPTISTSPCGPWTATAKGRARSRSTARTRSIRCPTRTDGRRSTIATTRPTTTRSSASLTTASR